MTDVLDYEDEPEAETPEDSEAPEAASGLRRLLQFANAQGDISEFLTSEELARLGAEVVREWKLDDQSREEWKKGVKEALKSAAQEEPGEKSYPFANAANVKYPLLTIAAQQFAARAMPAIVKGDEAIGIKVVGEAPVAPQLPQVPPNLPPEAAQQIQAELQPIIQAYQAAQAQWQAKQARAKRVKTYLNYQLFYGMDDWEGDTDALLNQLPIAGCAFRKVYWDANEGRCCSEFVNALNLTVAMDTKSLKRAPRITQDFELYPYEIDRRIRQGVYRDVVLIQNSEDEQAPRCVLEQHRLHDLDGDGVEEPYIVTVDVETEQVLRIDAAFTAADVTLEEGEVVHIERWVPYVKYGFLPDPKGRFYDIGFGQLLRPLIEVINTSVNQLLDAGHAQSAGGGFIASGVRLQGAGQQTTIRWQPGEYKTVNVPGNNVREALVERTLPAPSPVLFQLLELVLGAAKDVAAVNDVMTGDTPQNAPVGTTLALIEQGQQVFTSIYKRVYRAEREEFQLLYECEARYGNPADYADIVDDPQADFEADFNPTGRDIVPVSDPTVVTRMQALAKAQVIQQVSQAFPGVINGQVAAKRVFEAAEVDNPDELITAPQPNPLMEAKVEETKASAASKNADAMKKTVEAGQTFGELHAAEQGGVPGVEGAPGEPMGAAGDQGSLGGPEAGMAVPQLGQ